MIRNPQIRANAWKSACYCIAGVSSVAVGIIVRKCARILQSVFSRILHPHLQLGVSLLWASAAGFLLRSVVSLSPLFPKFSRQSACSRGKIRDGYAEMRRRRFPAHLQSPLRGLPSAKPRYLSARCFPSLGLSTQHFARQVEPDKVMTKLL